MMARATKKHKVDTFLWDTLNHSWSADIYTSGGSTHSVFVEVIDQDGKAVERYNKTFTGDSARQRAYDFAKSQRRESTGNYSKWMTPRLHPETCKGMAATEITKLMHAGAYKPSPVMDAIYYTAIQARPDAILQAVFDQGVAKSCLYKVGDELVLISEYSAKEISDLLV